MNFLTNKSVLLAAGVILTTTIPGALQAQALSAGQILEQGLAAKDKGEFEQALSIWEKANEQPGYAIGREYLNLVAVLEQKDGYEKATRMYYRGLGGTLFRESDRSAFENDLLYLKLIMNPEEVEVIQDYESEDQLSTFRQFWNRLDPTPAHPSNPRLIEHFARIQQAKNRFPDPDSPLGFDDRGKIWMRYGEPDKTLDRQLRVRRGEIHGFVSDILFETGSEEVNSVSLSGLTAVLKERSIQFHMREILIFGYMKNLTKI